MALLSNFRAGRLLDRLTETEAEPGKQTARTVAQLASLGAGAIEPILAAMPNASRPVHNALVAALTGIVNYRTVPTLLEAMAEGGPRLAPGIAAALKHAEDVPYPLLIEALRKPGQFKAPLLEVIKGHRDRIPARELLNTASSLEGNDKTALFRLIGESATVSMVPELINRLQGRDTLARLHLIGILERFDTPEVRLAVQAQLSDENKSIRSAALGALLKMEGPIDVERICKMLLDPEIEVQNRAVDVLIRAHEPDTILYLIPVLKDENEYSRRAAVEVLNEVGDASSIKHLLNAIKDSDWWVRSRAGDALGKIGGPRVIQAVLQLAREDDAELRRTAIEILNQTKDEHAVTQLIESTRDADWWVSERAVDALAAIGSKRALPRLLEMLGSCDDRQLPVVIRAVAALGDAQGIEHLLPLLKRPDRTVRIEVIQSLGHLSDERLAEHVRLQLQALAASGEQTIIRAVDGALAELNARFATDSEASQAGKTDQRRAGTTGRFRGLADGTTPKTMLMSEADVQQALRRVEPEQATAPRLDIATLRPGDTLEGRYKYIQRIGKGAFGTVLLMEDTVVDERLILKFLNPGVADDPEVMKRFVHELRYSRKITHHNVIRIYDFLEIRGNYAISMEYFPSHTLGSEVIDDKPLPLKRAIRFGMDMCTGMAVAHEVGIVHRDLKPANVLINDSGELKIVDFGVAAAHREGDTQLTKTGFVIGSPKYMAPEQILGRPVDERSDIYAIGVILYELLTGTPPYAKGDHMSVMYQHVQGKATPPGDLNPALPKGLGDVVMKAMAVDRNKRFQSMNDLKAALAPFG